MKMAKLCMNMGHDLYTVGPLMDVRSIKDAALHLLSP
jgi:hypothetical protein